MAALIRSMAVAGAPSEAIALAVEALECRDQKENERKAKRASQKATERRLSREGSATVARQGADNAATVAPQPLNSSPCAPPIENKTLTPPPSPPTSERERPRRAVRLTEDFKPTAKMIAVARRAEWSDAQIADECEKMRDWSMSNPTGARLDWEAVWRTWVKNHRANGARAGPRANGDHAKPSSLGKLHEISRGKSTDSGFELDEQASWPAGEIIDGTFVEEPVGDGFHRGEA